MNIVTLQQECGMQAYQEYIAEDLTGAKPIPFWEWYGLWCDEEGLFNDRASFQYDETED